MGFLSKLKNIIRRDFLILTGYSGTIHEERNSMKENVCIPGEYVLEHLEREIIGEKVRAYQIAMEMFFPAPILLQPAISNYKRKLERQMNVLFRTAKEIYMDPQRKDKILSLNFRKYYEKTPLYSILLLQIPPIFAPNFIRTMLRQLKRLNRRYFRRRINFLLILFERLACLETEMLHSENEIIRRIFDKAFLLEYIYSYIEIEQKKYQTIRKGGAWEQIPLQDFFHSFTLGSVSFYQYVSSIWKTIDEILPEFLRNKVEELYHMKTLADGQLDIVKGGNYRYKLVKEFPVPPEVMMEIFHDPEILMRNFPSKDKVKIEKISPDRLRYTLTEKIPLMKIVLKYDIVCKFEGNLEEWWVENSNYIKEMHGFALYEETEEGNCRYADILVDFTLDNQLKPFEDVIIPALESMGRKNIKELMENIYQELITHDKSLIKIRQDECKVS